MNQKTLLVAAVSIASLLVGFGVAQFMLLSPLRAENTELNQIIVERDSQIAELSTENTELANELTERGEEVTSLSHQLDEFNDTVNELQDSLLEICEENDLLCIQLEMINGTQDYFRELFEHEDVIVSFNDIVVEVPDEYIFYFSGLQDEEPDADSGILIGSKDYSMNSFSFSWTATDSPDLNKTLNGMYNLVAQRVSTRGERKNVTINQYQVLYEIHRMRSDNENVYIGYAAWYDPFNGYSLIYGMQESSGLSDSELLRFIYTYRYNTL